MNSNNIPSSFTKRDVFYRYAFIFVLAFILIVGSAFVLWYTNKETNKINKETAISDAQHFSSSVAQFRNFYAKTIVPAASKHGVEISHNYKNKEGILPLPATFAKDFGHSLSSDDSNFQVKLYSDKPFPWRHETMDKFEKEALSKLRKDPKTPVWSFETMNGEPVLRYASADILKPSCVSCHNSYPGTPKKDWKIGDIRGVLEVIRPMSGFNLNSLVVLKQSFLMMVGIILLMVLLLFFILRKLSSSIMFAHKAYLSSEEANKQLQKEIKKTEITSHNLKANEVKLRAIVNSVDEVIVVIDRKGIINECNKVVEEIFGYKVEEVIGQNINILMTSEHSGGHDGYIEQFVKSQTGDVMGRNREFFARRKNGEIFPIDLFVNDARIDNDIIFTGTIRDITERKKTEEMREQAHKAAIESAQLKSDFLANMSHEIRTPMNGVIGMTEMLLLSDLDSNQNDLAHTVKESAESLLVIINDILDYSKIEAGKLEIHKRKFNLLEMVESSLDLLATTAEQKQLGICFFIDQEVPTEINSDPVRLRQIMINLINNALKFTEHGYVILHVEKPQKDQLKFSIIDTGIGIPEDKLSTLFDMFSQVDSSLSREHGGTGLGLAICKQLVNLLDGDINVVSTKNIGSTFWFTIKIEETDVVQQPYIVAPKKVLFLNPIQVLNRYYKHQMLQWKMEPKIVSDANQLLQELEKNKYELIAIDVDAVFFDYHEDYGILVLLKALRKHTTSPVILYANATQLRKLETLKFDQNVQLLSKPLKHSVLKKLIEAESIATNDATSNVTSPAMADRANKIQKTDSPAIKKQPNQIKPKPQSTESVDKEKYHVLLAEDNRVNQKVAVAILGKFGCDVSVAENGKIAVEMAAKEDFDAIFMDCQMPVMDGYEATENIRKFSDEYLATIPIIAFTAHAMKDADIKCKDVGMDDYLTKPINIDELKSVLKDWSVKMDQRKKRRLVL